MDLNKVKNQHKGRGNSWLKLEENSDALKIAFEKLKEVDDKKLLNFFEKEGFGWVSFSKITKEKKVRYELRYRGCKLDHPDFVIDYELEEVFNLPLLGNTPHKLNLESNEKESLSKYNVVKAKKKESINKKENIEEEVEINISEVKLLKKENSSEEELDKFLTWCKLNNIY